MFVGHYGPSFAAKSAESRIPLWLLFLAVQFVDILWAIFVLLGIEKVRIVPGITASSPLDLYYMPYTHSLVGALGWSLLGYVVCQVFPKLRGQSTGLIVAAAVFSHWIIDLIVHRPDLPLYDSVFKMGFGLWNHRVPAFVLEMAVLFGGAAMYMKTIARKWKVYAFLGVLVVLQVIGTFADKLGYPLPSTDRATALNALALYIVLASIAWWVERGQAKAPIANAATNR